MSFGYYQTECDVLAAGTLQVTENLLVQLVHASDGMKATRNERFVQAKQHISDQPTL
jgi:hypothetical protein